jgi:hypothetical protein
MASYVGLGRGMDIETFGYMLKWNYTFLFNFKPIVH